MNGALLSLKQAGREYGLSPQRLRRMVDSGELKAAGTSTPTCTLVARGDLDRLLNRTTLVDLAQVEEVIRKIIHEELSRVFKL